MLMLCLLEKRGDFRQHFVHDGFWQGIHLAGVAGSQVDHARLIATHDAGGLDAGHRHGEAQASGERAAVGDRQDHQQLGRLIEFKRRHDQKGRLPLCSCPAVGSSDARYCRESPKKRQNSSSRSTYNQQLADRMNKYTVCKRRLFIDLQGCVNC